MLRDGFIAKTSNALGARGLRLVGRLNVPAYRLSGGRIGGKVGEGPVLLLTTTGRKSGEPRTAPILYIAHGEAIILIDTNGGNEKLPGWSYNLKADPRAEIEIGRRQEAVRARIATGAEREELWRAATAVYSGFDDYVEWLDRTPSVWVLERVRDLSPEPEHGTGRESAAAAADTSPSDII